MPLKTAHELGLTEEEHCALVKVLAALDDGRLNSEFGIRFNMESWGGYCGSACCIGGSAEAISGLRPGTLSASSGALAFKGNRELQNLFFPYHHIHGFGAWKATPKQAAKALRHYLTTGKEDWAGALRD